MRAAPPAASGGKKGESATGPETLAAAFQHALIAIAFGTPDGHLRDINPAFARLLGYERGELLGLPFNEVTHPDDRAADVAQWERLAAGEVDVYQQEKRYLRKDGSVLWGVVTVSALRDESGRFLGSMAQIQDMAAQKTTKEALNENEAYLEALVEQLPVVLYSQPWGEGHAIRSVSARFEQLTGLSRNDFPANSGEYLDRVHPEDRARVRATDERANRTGEPVHVEYRLRGSNDEWIWLEHHSVLAHDDRGRPLSWHGSIIDISERKRLQATLRESEARFRRAFEDAAIGMALGAPDNTCLDVNPAYCAIVGYSRDELIGRSFEEITHPEDRAEQRRRKAQLRAGTIDSFVVKKRYLARDGRVVKGLVTISAVRDDTGQLLYCIGQLQDISALQATESALRENEELLRTIVEQGPAAVYRLETGENGRFTFGSSRFAFLSGLSIPEGVNTLADFFARVHPDDIDMVREADAWAFRTGETLEVEYRLRTGDGSWVWVHDRSSPTRDEQGQIVAWFGILLDISERKRLQAELHANDERLGILVEQLPVALYSMTPGPDTRYTYVSPTFSALTGMSAEEIALGSDALQARIHPDDQDPVLHADAHAVATETAYESNYRVRGPDGDWVWLQDRALLARDAAGQPLAWHGTLIDTTAQRLLEQSLRESEERFRSTFEGAAIGMVLTTPDGRFLIANPALEHLLGFEPGELAGIHSDDITLHADQAVQRNLRERLRSGAIDNYQFEKRFVRKDGNIVWVVLNATAIRDGHGTLQTVIVQVQDVTDRKAAEASLRASEARFRSTFEGAGIGMTLTLPDGRFIDANPAFCRFIGRSRDELLALTSLDLAHPEDRAASQALINQLVNQDIDTFSTEKRYLRPDGGAVWGDLTVTATRAPDGQFSMMIAQIQDITSRKDAESALRESEARFRAVVQNDPDVVVLVDRAMNITYVSPSALAVFGASAGQKIDQLESPGQPFARYADLFHPEDVARTWNLIAATTVPSGTVSSEEVRIRHADETWHWFEVNVVNLLDEPGIQGFLVNLRDITERKQAELATAAALTAQEAAIAELERLNNSKSRFLSTISHEFRTPLTAIIGYSEFMMSNAADSALVAEDAEVIHREANRLSRMVDDVLLIDRVDAGRLSLNTVAVDLNAISRDVAATFRPLTEKHPLRLTLDAKLRLVAGDRDRLAQALTNLVSNAVKYSPNGGPITISTRNEDDSVILSIRDEGIGIRPDDLTRIFERFERVETGIAGRIGGTGLGLSIVAEILALHGGHVWVESEPGEGSVFHIALPALPPALLSA